MWTSQVYGHHDKMARNFESINIAMYLYIITPEPIYLKANPSCFETSFICLFN